MANKITQIFFIYAENCEHCNKALAILNKIIENKSCKINSFHYDTPQALQIAVKHGIDDLPGIVIGNTSFKGNGYTEEKLVEALKKNS